MSHAMSHAVTCPIAAGFPQQRERRSVARQGAAEAAVAAVVAAVDGSSVACKAGGPGVVFQCCATNRGLSM